tara:strand:+ start:28111 stop:28362 length:252 start_codon:yes stop_codon:yes gene_type:complete
MVLTEAISILNQIEQDDTVSRNIRTRVKVTITILQDNKDDAINVAKSVQELEEISDDNNLPSYIRTQIWNVVSLLEGIDNRNI